MTEHSTWKLDDGERPVFDESSEFAAWCESRGWTVSIVSYEVDPDD